MLVHRYLKWVTLSTSSPRIFTCGRFRLCLPCQICGIVLLFAILSDLSTMLPFCCCMLLRACVPYDINNYNFLMPHHNIIKFLTTLKNVSYFLKLKMFPPKNCALFSYHQMALCGRHLSRRATRCTCFHRTSADRFTRRMTRHSKWRVSSTYTGSYQPRGYLLQRRKTLTTPVSVRRKTTVWIQVCSTWAYVKVCIMGTLINNAAFSVTIINSTQKSGIEFLFVFKYAGKAGFLNFYYWLELV